MAGLTAIRRCVCFRRQMPGAFVAIKQISCGEFSGFTQDWIG